MRKNKERKEREREGNSCPFFSWQILRRASASPPSLSISCGRRRTHGRGDLLKRDKKMLFCVFCVCPGNGTNRGISLCVQEKRQRVPFALGLGPQAACSFFLFFFSPACKNHERREKKRVTMTMKAVDECKERMARRETNTKFGQDQRTERERGASLDLMRVRNDMDRLWG